MVVIEANQLEKEIEKEGQEKGKAIYIEMVEKEVDKLSQVGESQMSLITIVAMSGVGKEWENITD